MRGGCVIIQLWLTHNLLVALCSPIPHGVAPQQSSTMLRTAAQRYKAPENDQKTILQFDPLTQSTIKLSCNLTYTPKMWQMKCKTKEPKACFSVFSLNPIWELVSNEF